METALYLLPVTLGDTPVEKVLPSYNKEIISGIRHFIVEDIRSARRFLKKVDREIDIDALTFYPLNKHTSPEDISGYLPIEPDERAKKLKTLEQRAYSESQTQLFIETPYRNHKMIEDILQNCRPQTKLCIAANITCEGEYIQTRTVKDWKGHVPELSKIPCIFLLYK